MDRHRLLLFGDAAGGFGGGAGENIKSQLVAYYDFDTNANDRTGRGNNLSVGGGSPTYELAVGKPFEVALVRATPDHLLKADSADVRFGAKDWTLATWVKIASKPAGAMTIICKDNISVTREMVLSWDNVNDRFNLYCFSGGTTIRVSNLQLTALGAPVIGDWYFLTVSYNLTANLVTLTGRAVGGAEIVTTATPSGSLGTGAAVFRVGGQGTLGTTSNLDGSVSSTGKWDRVLTTAERNYMYRSGLGRSFAQL